MTLGPLCMQKEPGVLSPHVSFHLSSVPAEHLQLRTQMMCARAYNET